MTDPETKEKNATPKIEPQACPGCGAVAKISKNNSGSRWKILCSENKTTLSRCQKSGHMMLSRKEAVRVWNDLK